MKRTIQTKAYGLVEIDLMQILTFPEGLLGFEEYHEFALIDAHKKPFFWLQSLEETRVAFVLIQPSIFQQNYDHEIMLDDLAIINAQSLEDCQIFSIITIPEFGAITANLQGPLFINKKNRQGKQCISPSDKYRTKHDIFEEIAAQRK